VPVREDELADLLRREAARGPDEGEQLAVAVLDARALGAEVHLRLAVLRLHALAADEVPERRP
jgi:hypothetical protein